MSDPPDVVDREMLKASDQDSLDDMAADFSILRWHRESFYGEHSVARASPNKKRLLKRGEQSGGLR
jgi:hypothetical protein